MSKSSSPTFTFFAQFSHAVEFTAATQFALPSPLPSSSLPPPNSLSSLDHCHCPARRRLHQYRHTRNIEPCRRHPQRIFQEWMKILSCLNFFIYLF
jgi:hypothetical protein